MKKAIFITTIVFFIGAMCYLSPIPASAQHIPEPDDEVMTAFTIGLGPGESLEVNIALITDDENSSRPSARNLQLELRDNEGNLVPNTTCTINLTCADQVKTCTMSPPLLDDRRFNGLVLQLIQGADARPAQRLCKHDLTVTVEVIDAQGNTKAIFQPSTSIPIP